MYCCNRRLKNESVSSRNQRTFLFVVSVHNIFILVILMKRCLKTNSKNVLKSYYTSSIILLNLIVIKRF